jgi:2-C-methyl-D-erythritol 4-phosphate cytidylyltransferase
MNVGIILAAGKSTRFESENPKQLHEINGLPIVNHSINTLSSTLDEVIIITNTHCLEKIHTDKKILVNDIDDRILSIKTGIDYLKGSKWDNIVIHDAARPFITKETINQLIISQKDHVHSQYYLPLVNGLAKLNKEGVWEIPDRDKHIQLCSPQITKFDLFLDLFQDYIETKKECEILTIVSTLRMGFNLILGDKNIRKVTNYGDL